MTTTQSTQPTQADPIAEIRSTRETAEKIANEGATEGTDVARLLGGLIAHLAEQVEKLADASMDGLAGGQRATNSPKSQTPDADQEEDVSPEAAPAAPARDPNGEG